MEILIADDDPMLRQYVALRLRDIANIHQACDGPQTLTELKKTSIDLLLLDWAMPVLDGLEVLRIIRSRGFQLPVIMVTAECSRARVLEALNAGATDYLVKPFEATALRVKVARFTPQPGQEAAAQQRERLNPTNWKQKQ